MTEISPSALRADGEIFELLSFSFDFMLLDDDRTSSWFVVEGCDRLRIIAEDGLGGVFLLWGPEQRLAYVSSEGQAGVIAANLAEGLDLIVAYPYWRDLIDRDLNAMRDAVEYLEGLALGDDGSLDELRAEIRSLLSLRDSGRQLERLHHAVTSLGAGFQVRSKIASGALFASLAG